MSARRVLTDEEIQLLIDEGFTGNEALRNKALFCFGLSTGYRVKELLSHFVRDVVLKKNIQEHIELPARLRKGSSMGQAKELMPFARQALQDHVDNMFELSGEETYGGIFGWPLFPSNKTNKHTGELQPISVPTACQIFQEAFDRCDITGAVGTHSMRKTAAKKVYTKALKDFREGKLDVNPLRVLKMFLGHKDIASTEKYATFLSYDLDKSQFNFKV